MKLNDALTALLWAGTTGIVISIFRLIFSQTILKAIKNSESAETKLRQDVDESKQMITRIFLELDKVKAKQDLFEQGFRLELLQLQRKYDEIKSDMKEGFDDLKQLIRDQQHRTKV